jgi:hypothetical protein
MKDEVIASALLLIGIIFLMNRNLTYLSVWLLIISVVLKYGTRMSYTVSVVIAVIAVLAVIMISGQRLRERFEDNSDDSTNNIDKDDSPKNDEEPEAHMDIGQTLLKAYNKLDSGQIQGLQSDTKELMETQQQLIQTLASLGPQVQQGAELIKSFQGMFGGNLTDVLKQ